MNKPPVVDQSPQGKRVRLVNADLLVARPGARGTVASWTTFDLGEGLTQRTLQVEWDDYPDMSLVEGNDEWDWLDEAGATRHIPPEAEPPDTQGAMIAVEP